MYIPTILYTITCEELEDDVKKELEECSTITDTEQLKHVEANVLGEGETW